MKLQLDAKSIRLKSLRITAGLELATVDASGQTSSTDVAETGIKAKTLTVSGMLPFTNADHLSEIFTMAEALTDGARTVYRISNSTAAALGVKQVRFAGKIEAVEQETTRQWAVSFQLQEYRSVPQKTEERLPETTATEQGTGDTLQYANLQPFLQKKYG